MSACVCFHGLFVCHNSPGVSLYHIFKFEYTHTYVYQIPVCVVSVYIFCHVVIRHTMQT